MNASYTLRDYIHVLLAQSRFIVLTALVLSLAGGLLLLIWPRDYQASALVVLRQQNYSLRFDTRFETLEGSQNRDVFLSIYNALPSLALSDVVLGDVLAQLDPPLPAGQHTIQGLRDQLSASLQSNSSALALRALSPDPAQAQRLVNLWAQAFVPRANNLYSESLDDLERLRQELEDARVLRDDAENLMIAFRAEDVRVFLNSELSAMRASYDTYRLNEQAVQQLRLDLNSFGAQLNEQAGDMAATLEDELTLLRLQMAVHGFADASSPIVQIESGAGGPVSQRPRSAIRASLDDLQRSLDMRLQELGTLMMQLEQDSITISNEIDLLNLNFERVQENLDIARQTYNALHIKVEESQIAVSLEDDRIRLASLAALPDEPAGPSRVLLGLLILGLALATGIAAAFFRAYWRESAPSHA